jgi:ferredoxin-type protein NapG
MPYSRRTFLKMTGTAVVTVSALGVGQLLPVKAELIRPPGAVAEADFKNVCLRCHQCLDVCPFKSISAAHFTDGWANVATPVLANPCTLCMKCTEQCPTGALTRIAANQAKMGTAVVLEKECVGCDRCIKPCPNGAISKVPGKRLVAVDTAKCTGCMTCVKACPVQPVALVVTAAGAKRPAFSQAKA